MLLTLSGISRQNLILKTLIKKIKLFLGMTSLKLNTSDLRTSVITLNRILDFLYFRSIAIDESCYFLKCTYNITKFLFNIGKHF